MTFALFEESTSGGSSSAIEVSLHTCTDRTRSEQRRLMSITDANGHFETSIKIILAFFEAEITLTRAAAAAMGTNY